MSFRPDLCSLPRRDLHEEKRAEREKSKKDTKQRDVSSLLALRDHRGAALSIDGALRDTRAA